MNSNILSDRQKRRVVSQLATNSINEFNTTCSASTSNFSSEVECDVFEYQTQNYEICTEEVIFSEKSPFYSSGDEFSSSSSDSDSNDFEKISQDGSIYQQS